MNFAGPDIEWLTLKILMATEIGTCVQDVCFGKTAKELF